MKTRYNIYIMSIIVLLIFWGCDDFLKEEPKGLITPDEFFNSEAEANLAIDGLVARMRTGEVTGEHMVYYQFLGTDLGVVARNQLPGINLVGVYDFDSSNGRVAIMWRELYAGIKDANLVINRIAESPSLSDEEKGRLIAQAQFFRAYIYYRLTTMWGDVPFWKDEIDIEEVSLLGKTPASTIQADMIGELQSAIDSGLLSTGRWNQNDGKVTVWAVKMLKAHYHMWRAEYNDARTELIDITQNSPHGPDLAPFGDIFREGNDLNNEIIFGVEFLRGIISNNIHNVAHPNAGAEADAPFALQAFEELDIFTRAALITLRRSFADSFDPNDARLPYTVFDSHTLTDGTAVAFNHIYITKFLRAKVPVSDPLFINPEPDGQTSQPNRLMRLADAYLMLAEAEFMIGGSSAAALAAINKVRQRANLPDLTTLTLADIRQERAWELAGEGFGRKTDLIRWGILESTVAALPAAEAAAGAHPQSQERAQGEADRIAAAPGKFLFLPIPFDEITKSENLGGTLVQNPVWIE